MHKYLFIINRWFYRLKKSYIINIQFGIYCSNIVQKRKAVFQDINYIRKCTKMKKQGLQNICRNICQF